MEVERESKHVYRVVFSDGDLFKLGVISEALNREIEDMMFLIFDVTLHEVNNFLIRKDG